MPLPEYSAKEVNLALGADQLRRQVVFRNAFEGSLAELAEVPFEPDFAARHGERLEMLTHNAISFPDEIEELIGQNQLLQRIIEAKRHVHGETEQKYMNLKRSQRVLLACHIDSSSITKGGTRTTSKNARLAVSL